MIKKPPVKVTRKGVLNIEVKLLKKPSWSMPTLPMIISIFTTGFSTKNGFLTISAAIGVYTLFYAGYWLLWLIRTYFHQKRRIDKLTSNYDAKTDELNSIIKKMDKLKAQNQELEKANSTLDSEIKSVKINRDTLIVMNEELKNENNISDARYTLLSSALFHASLTNKDIEEFIKKFINNKEIIDGTKAISYSKNNQ